MDPTKTERMLKWFEYAHLPDTLCRETRWALGWIDTDSDGILDARGQ